eukprot:g7604.t1
MCSKSCGAGFHSHERSIVVQPLRGGEECGELVATQPCNGNKCEQDCVVGAWSGWGECSQECGGGQRARTRDITTLPLHGGKECPPLGETEPCNTDGCICSHVTCAFAKHTYTGRMRIQVLHHNKEQNGHSHRCGFNYASGKCECKCFGEHMWSHSDPTNKAHHVAGASPSAGGKHTKPNQSTCHEKDRGTTVKVVQNMGVQDCLKECKAMSTCK